MYSASLFGSFVIVIFVLFWYLFRMNILSRSTSLKKSKTPWLICA